MVTNPSHCRNQRLLAISRLTGLHPFGGDRPPEPAPPWPPPLPPRGRFTTLLNINSIIIILIIYLPQTWLPRPFRHVYPPFFHQSSHPSRHNHPYNTTQNYSACKASVFPSRSPFTASRQPWSTQLQPHHASSSARRHVIQALVPVSSPPSTLLSATHYVSQRQKSPPSP